MENLMTVPEIAVKLRKAVKTVYHYVETGVIPASLIIRIENTIRMYESDLDKLVKSLRGK